MRLQVDTTQLDNVVEWLRATGLKTDDLSAPLSDAADIMLEDIRQAFSTQGASIGESWKPHAETTETRWGAHSLLNLSGLMYGGLAKFVRPFLAGIEDTVPTSILMERGRDLGSGSSRAGRKTKRAANVAPEEMPERPFLRINDATVDKAAEFILDYMLGEGRWS